MFLIDLIKLFKLVSDSKNEYIAAKYLTDTNSSLAIAESCTGGLLSSLMTDVSGSSSYTKVNFVTYANEAKNKYLGVSKDTLEQYGAVSEQTATEMAAGLLKETSADYALATTGIAGPDGGTKEKPVGLIYIAVGNNSCIKVHKYNVNPKYPRLLIKYIFAKQAVKFLSEFLKGNIK